MMHNFFANYLPIVVIRYLTASKGFAPKEFCNIFDNKLRLILLVKKHFPLPYCHDRYGLFGSGKPVPANPLRGGMGFVESDQLVVNSVVKVGSPSYVF